MKAKESPFPFLFSGKFGGVVGRIVNGKQVIAKCPGPRKNKPTLHQLNTERNMATAVRFLKPIVPVLRKYDEEHRKGFHKATSQVLRNAMCGTAPDQRINCSLVILGEGSLPNPKTFQVLSPAKGVLEFTWALDGRRMLYSKSDRIFTVVYCEAGNQFLYELTGPKRRERKFRMDASYFSGQRVEVWFGFASLDGFRVSTSIYAGPVNVL